MAIEHLHQNNTIYRDLKPENVLVASDGHIKLADFGLSRELEENQLAKSFVGSPPYLAPEVLRGEAHDKTMDWYGLGTLLYECLTSVPPHYSRDDEERYENIKNAPVALGGRFTPACSDLLAQLLHKDPSKRLGATSGLEELKAHPWFAEIDWQGVQNKWLCPKVYKHKQLSDKRQMAD
jgi:serine/threonine protein kinase